MSSLVLKSNHPFAQLVIPDTIDTAGVGIVVGLLLTLAELAQAVLMMEGAPVILAGGCWGNSASHSAPQAGGLLRGRPLEAIRLRH